MAEKAGTNFDLTGGNMFEHIWNLPFRCSRRTA